MPRDRVRLPFGAGLDRETGEMASKPASFEDLRNVTLYRGKAAVRPGVSVGTTLQTSGGRDCTHVLALEPIKTESAIAVVGYHQPTGEVNVYRVSALGDKSSLVGTWFTLDDGDDPPIVHAAETFGKVLLAHDTVSPSSRAQSYVYDPLSGQTLRGISADLDGNGSSPVRFRGVAATIDYSFGWGFGTATEDRPEMVRVSLPGAPETFTPPRYFITGDRANPVLSCTPVSGGVVVQKVAESHFIPTQQGLQGFAINEIDERYGVVGPRLAVSHDGSCYFWSDEGPRVIGPQGPSQDLSIPLDLSNFQPSGLATEGSASEAFAAYIPGEKAIEFVFGKLAYRLSIREQGKWSYSEYAVTPRSAGTAVQTLPAAENPPQGHPEVASTTPSDTSIQVTIDNVDAEGDELMEMWAKPSGGSWTKNDTVFVTGDPQQVENLNDLTPGTDYDLAFRYRRGTSYTAGYESDDPSQWPSESRATATTTLSAPTLKSTDWERVDASTERAILTIEPAHLNADLEILRDGSAVKTVSAPHDPEIVVYDTGVSGETFHNFQARHTTSNATGSASSTKTQWMGPPAPTVDSFDAADVGGGLVQWTNADEDAHTRLYDDVDGLNTLDSEYDPGQIQGNVTFPDQSQGDTVCVAAKHALKQFGVTDLSPQSNQQCDTIE